MAAVNATSPAAPTLPVVQQLSCPQCGSPVSLHLATAQTVVCPKCSAHIALGAETLEAASARKLPHPRVPVEIGQSATIDGVSWIVLGRVMLQGSDDGETFKWNEWLLGSADGRMLWLSHDEHGFRLYTRMRFRQPFDARSDMSIPLGDGRTMSVTERYPARIVGAEGELTWRAKPGDGVFMVEGRGNGKTYSIQVAEDEIELYESLDANNVAIHQAFAKTQSAEAQAAMAPRRNPLMQLVGLLCVAFGLVGGALALASGAAQTTTLTEEVRLTSAQPIVTVPVTFQRVRRPVLVSMDVLSSLPENTFADIDMSVIAPDESESLIVSEEFWHETGVDEGEFWREQDLNGAGEFVPFQDGQHQIAFELGTEAADQLQRVGSVEVRVRVVEGYFTTVYVFIYAAVAIVIGLALMYFNGGLNIPGLVVVALAAGAVFVLFTATPAALRGLFGLFA